jgi:hypothetical protein
MLLNLLEVAAMSRVFPLHICPLQSWPQPPAAVVFQAADGSMSEQVHEQYQLFLPHLLYLPTAELLVLFMGKRSSKLIKDYTCHKAQRELFRIACLLIGMQVKFSLWKEFDSMIP